MSTVSVIVPTYRRDWVLTRALASLAAQTYSSLEIIVVDDNDHPDWNSKVQIIVDEFVSQNPSIPVLFIQNHPNLGSARARNVGIDHASGQFVCFLDDDDIYLPERISNQVTLMQNSCADYSVTDLALYSEEGTLIEIRKRSHIKDTSSRALFQFHMMHHITGTDTMMFRKDYLLKIGKFPLIDVGDEFYLMQKAIEGNGKFLHAPFCDVKAYIHNEVCGLSSGMQKIAGEKQLFQHKSQYFDKLPQQCIRHIKMRHHAVVAFAYLRMRDFDKFFYHCIASFFEAPVSCLNLFLHRLLSRRG